MEKRADAAAEMKAADRDAARPSSVFAVFAEKSRAETVAVGREEREEREKRLRSEYGRLSADQWKEHQAEFARRLAA